MRSPAADIAHAAVDAAIAMLKQQGLEHQLPQLPKLLQQAAEERTGISSATLITPSGDAGSLATVAAAALQQRFGRPITIVQKADPSLMGGAILQCGDERIDMSLKGALNRAHASIAS